MMTSIGLAEVKSALLANTFIIIDVRNKEERSNPGRIPGTWNIPRMYDWLKKKERINPALIQVSTLEDAFQGSETSFEADYDFKKPKKDDKIALHCKMGVRARKAGDTLVRLGYHNVFVFEGGIDEWIRRDESLLRGTGHPSLAFEEVKANLAHGQLIDVRTPKEFENGHIPKAVNIPLSDIWHAFNMPEDDFKTKYGLSKLPMEAFILYCLKGKRATDAADKLFLLNVPSQVYLGSFHDWFFIHDGPVET